MILNPFDEFFRLSQILGPLWAAVAVAAVAFAFVAPFHRAVFFTLFVLLCTQIWYSPVYAISRGFRWWIVGIVLVRGVITYMPVASLTRGTLGRGTALALAVLAVASAAWADSWEAAIALAASLAVGMYLVFGILWKVLDRTDLPSNIPGAATWLGMTIFGSGFLVVICAYLFDDPDFLLYTGFAPLEGARYKGVFTNPNMAGLLGAALLPFVVVSDARFLGRHAWMRWPAILCMAATIFLSGSRSALIGSFLALGLLAAYRSRIGTLFLLGAGALGVWFLASFGAITNVDDSMFGHITRTKHIGTLSGRVELWEAGWEAVQSNVVHGLGWGASRNLFGEYDVDKMLSQGGLNFASNLHSAHVQILVDLGFLGLLLFWMFCGLTLAAGWKLMRAPRTPRMEVLVVVFASFVGMLADSFVHGGLFSMGSPGALAFWTFACIVMKEAARLDSQPAPNGAGVGPAGPQFPVLGAA